MNTIAALATPYGKGAIHIIRVSGYDTYKLLNSISKYPVLKDENRIQLNYILTNKSKQTLDQVLLIKFYSPNSYTGEDLIEINCHGSILIVSLILQELLNHGAILAKEGEFTKRALLNNKLTLNEVENINSLFSAHSLYDINLSAEELMGKNSQILKQASEDLFQLIGQTESEIDYPPDSKQAETFELTTLISKITTIKNTLDDLLKSSKACKSSAYRVCLLGKPNAGKSSLLNYLLNDDKAIVSNIPGTTRDIIEQDYFYKNYLLTLVDSAGIRPSDDFLEQESILRTKREIERANIIFFLISVEDIDDPLNQHILSLIKDKKYVVIYTKGDLPHDKALSPIISVHDKNLEGFYHALDQELIDDYAPTGIKNEYIIGNLYQCVEELKQSLESNLTIDLISEKLIIAREYLLDSLGITENNLDRINKIFDNFCIGK